MLSGSEKEAGLCWLQQAKICRATGHFEAAVAAGLEALAREVPGAVIEHAKLLWDTDQPYRAIARLQQVYCYSNLLQTTPPCIPAPQQETLSRCAPQTCSKSDLLQVFMLRLILTS